MGSPLQICSADNMKKSYFQSLSFRVTFWVSLTVVAIVSIHIYLMRPERRFFEQKMMESERMSLVIETHLLAEMSAGEPDNIQNHLADSCQSVFRRSSRARMVTHNDLVKAGRDHRAHGWQKAVHV